MAFAGWGGPSSGAVLDIPSPPLANHHTGRVKVEIRYPVGQCFSLDSEYPP